MKRYFLFLVFYLFLLELSLAQKDLPDTGISGVYEVMVATDDPAWYIRYFEQFGFQVVDSAQWSADQVKELYGINTDLRSYRMQNGEVDSHGLLRILAWEDPLGIGVGYSEPETIGSRMAVMRTQDIIRLVDIYQMERANGKAWYPIEPIFDDLYDMSDQQIDFFNRPIGVRETAIYGEKFNHVFFQRYGYQIPGYGTIGKDSPLQCSEFTHHDFIVKGDMDEITRYYSEALGFKPEQEKTTIAGDWLKGPKRVFDMPEGYSHFYRGFVSPNNVCGKLKFFIPRNPKPDRSEHQRIGELGITLHSLYTPKLQMVYDLIKEQNINPTEIQANEFGERCFLFTGPDGASWQIIEKTGAPRFNIIKEFKLEKVNN